MLIAALPGYDAWGDFDISGAAAVVGIFIRGEYTAANPLAMEYSSKREALTGLGYTWAFVKL